MGRQEFSGSAARTTLASGINNTDLSISVASGTGYPTGTNPFVIVIDRGLSTEEKILCDSRSGNTITVNASGRGYDGTTGQSHSAGAYVEHTVSAAKLDELDLYVNSAFTGDVTAASGAKVTTIANNAVTTAKIADDNVTLAKLANIATASFLGRTTSGTGDVEVLSVAQALALLALDSTDLSDFTEAVQDVIGAQVGLGGAGLSFAYDDAANTITVTASVDGATLEVVADAIRIKDLGVVTAKINDLAVTAGKLAAGAVTAAKLDASLPRGVIDWQVLDTAATGYTNGVISDIVPLSVTTPVLDAGRLLKATITVPTVNSATADAVLEVMVREGATQLGSALFKIEDVTTGDNGGTVTVLIAPTAAAHTYKVSATLATAVGSGNIGSAATRPMWFMVEDIGAA